jgi:hypothetical protein
LADSLRFEHESLIERNQIAVPAIQPIVSRTCASVDTGRRRRDNMFRLLNLWTLVVLAVITWTIWPKNGTAISAGKAAPDIAGENWINSKPLTIADLKARVVLVEFWTYG